ncbi:hypothetical protein M409DRAFT_71225 [Zasmidium cellare ATCC 36951]|uniref:Mob1/phocein n=1 Tax=Zasmidium cellare ATCC 36951 TaxID=1080233 RepID=A0A6A6C074_ZASCE|nr:uncharacterized protein M409DRAFT_71225 [Zasmidium cellare ATCC 36951]KAF2159096.1 hypothetical protein M409DRAFT_71225 [Zasmidium cellare ATCC 36951]
MQVNEQAHQSNQGTRKPPFFFREEYAGYIVKGNFMTLAAKPHLVEEGEWMSHQIVEQNRNLSGMLKIVQEADRSTGLPICNEKTCPAMSAGSTTYSWMDTNRNPINLPAPTYVKHIQTWVAGKIFDDTLFPTLTFQTPPTLPNPQQVSSDPNHWLGKTSGFPQRFESEIKNMYKQMFRCYAHLYWSHWLDFWNLGAHRELNTCFVHFVNVGRIFGLLSDRDTEPMQPLIDLWIRKGDLPQSKENESAQASATASTPTAAGSAASTASTAPPSSGADGSSA